MKYTKKIIKFTQICFVFLYGLNGLTWLQTILKFIKNRPNVLHSPAPGAHHSCLSPLKKKAKISHPVYPRPAKNRHK